MRVSEIGVKRIRVNQGLGVVYFVKMACMKKLFNMVKIGNVKALVSAQQHSLKPPS